MHRPRRPARVVARAAPSFQDLKQVALWLVGQMWLLAQNSQGKPRNYWEGPWPEAGHADDCMYYDWV